MRPGRLDVPLWRVYYRSAMSATDEAGADRRWLPRDYLKPGEEWFTVTEGTTSVSYERGKLVWNAPGAVYLLQDISLRLRMGLNIMERNRKKLRSTDTRKWTLQRLADESGRSLRTINDLLQGKTWANVETIANLEMFFEWPLWTDRHIRIAKATRQPPRGIRRRAKPSAWYARLSAKRPPPSDDQFS